MGGTELRGSTSRPSPQSPKGILGSPPPRLKREHAADHCNHSVYNVLCERCLVKMHYPRGKFYVGILEAEFMSILHGFSERKSPTP
jgi:hypothetical protein